MYSASFGATGWGAQLPAQFPNASPYNLPQELWDAGYRDYGQDGSRLSSGAALLVVGLVAVGAAGTGVLIAWLAERRAARAAAAVE